MTLTFLERLRPRRDPPPLVFEGLAQVRAYWEGLREGTRCRSAPHLTRAG